MSCARDTSLFDAHNHRTLGAGLANVAPLRVARVDDVRVLTAHRRLMDVTECPIVMTGSSKLVEAAGRVRGMTRVTIERGVENGKVETPGHRPTVFSSDVVGRLDVLVAAAVDGNAKVGKINRLAAPIRERVNAFRHREVTGDAAAGVVIAVGDERANAGARQASELGERELACSLVLPRSVVEVTGDDDERCLFGDREVDDVREGAPCGAPDERGESRVLRREPAQRAIEMNVSRVDESEVGAHAYGHGSK
jgi:hypothetical protein